MKIKLEMMPSQSRVDDLEDAIAEAIQVDNPGVLPDESYRMAATIAERLERWFQFGKFLMVEIDTEALTVTAVESEGGR